MKALLRHQAVAFLLLHFLQKQSYIERKKRNINLYFIAGGRSYELCSPRRTLETSR